MRTLGGEEYTQPGCRFSQKSGQIASKLKLVCIQVRYSPRPSGTPLINVGGKGAVQICPPNSNLSFSFLFGFIQQSADFRQAFAGGFGGAAEIFILRLAAPDAVALGDFDADGTYRRLQSF